MTLPGDDDGEIGGIQPVARGSESAPTEAAEAVGGTDRVEAASAIAPSEASAAAGAVEGITADLAAGTIDPLEAQARLIDEAVRAQLPEGVDPAVEAEVRAEVAALLAADPTLSRLLTP